jgi:hypothetical protein
MDRAKGKQRGEKNATDIGAKIKKIQGGNLAA